MKKWLQEKLICPECLNQEAQLDLEIQEEQNQDVLEGQLTCRICRSQFPIHKGIAVLLPHNSMSILIQDTGYNSKGMLSSYMWSHYGDLLKDQTATDAYKIWSAQLEDTDGWALDIGCSVGRLSFEMTRTHPNVVGMDSSISFVQKAREMMDREQLDFEMVIEGRIMETRSFTFQNGWNKDRVEFIVADAMAMPFPRNSFATVASVNILEKVPHPVRHLTEINRVMEDREAMFLFSDPFSWDENFVDPALWLGGQLEGPYACRGTDTMHRLFAGEDGIFDPVLTVTATGDVAWKIRKTENLWEHINSQLIVGKR